MKKADLLAVGYAALCVAVICLFPVGIHDGHLAWVGLDGHGLQNFGKVTGAFPYSMGFLKVAFLATFGELIKYRGQTGSYRINRLPVRFVVWGLFGMLFTVLFALFGKGLPGMMVSGLWFGMPPKPGANLGQVLPFAISASALINLVSAYPMMLFHEWCNAVIAAARFVGGTEFLEKLNKPAWGSFIPKTIVIFWIPAHTITFMMPDNYRVLMAAGLSVVLGFVLTIKPRPAVPAKGA